MKIYKAFLFPIILVASCTSTRQTTTSGNNSTGTTAVTSDLKAVANDSTSNLRRAAIDRSRFSGMPVRVKVLTPDSIPRP